MKPWKNLDTSTLSPLGILVDLFRRKIHMDITSKIVKCEDHSLRPSLTYNLDLGCRHDQYVDGLVMIEFGLRNHIQSE